MDLPLVDFADSPERQAATLGQACAEYGFFSIPQSVIPPETLPAARQAIAEFFALPTEEKMLVAFPSDGYPYGYAPLGYERLAASLGMASPADLKETFSVGPDTGGGSLGDDPDQAWVRSPSLWPDRPSGLRFALEEYFSAMAQVAEHLMAVMARALDLPTDFFVPLIDQPISSLRAINYPKHSPAAPKNALRAGAHTDYGTFTVLHTDQVPGLEIQDSAGNWQSVTPNPDVFVVNLGDSIARWTNDRWRSTLHRVTTASSEQRQSLAFFHMANWDAFLDCLPTCQDAEQPALYQPVQAGPWLKEKFQATGSVSSESKVVVSPPSESAAT